MKEQMKQKKQELELPPVYGVWAQGQRGGGLEGQQGYIRKDGQILFFGEDGVDMHIWQLKQLQMNGSPAAIYSARRLYQENGEVVPVVDVEDIRRLDTANPAFDPHHFEVREQSYDNTGGGTMVAISEMYLPQLERSVWVGTSDECAIIASTNYLWSPYGGRSFSDPLYDFDANVHEDASIYEVWFSRPVPEDAAPWMPMLQAHLEYAIGKESVLRPVTWPARWLPPSILEQGEPDYFSWLEERGKEPSIWKGKLQAEPEYRQADQSQTMG